MKKWETEQRKVNDKILRKLDLSSSESSPPPYAKLSNQLDPAIISAKARRKRQERLTEIN